MAPAPQEHILAAQEMPGAAHIDSGMKDDAIVISGMSGVYPQSSSVKELSELLYNKVDPMTPTGTRWSFKHPESASYAGMAPALERFDAQFFTIFYRLGNYLDPMARKLLEHTYQALYDAGVSPLDLNGKKVAVFMGSSFSDMETRAMMDSRSETGLGIIGTNKAMFANRISYWLNIKGPSLGVDEIDCSSFIALEQAVSAINRGDCEAAIVGGACLNLNPHASIYHKRLSCQPADGKTKSFAANADGYALGDAVGVLFLQKKKNALRVYAEVTHVKNEFIAAPSVGSAPNFGFYRNPQATAKFIEQFYKEAQIPPQAVEYVEAYGTGVPEADKSELEAIAEVYCKERTKPLMIGSVTSNIGVTEAASGVTGIVKVLLSYVNGKIPANLHYDQPRQDVEALREGRMRVITENQLFGRTYAAVNGMSVSGVNSHVLLQGHYKQKDLSRYKSAIPHLVTISGRQETAVQRVIDDLKSRPVDAEELALLHNIHSKNTSGHLGRGYVILDSDENNNTICLNEEAEFFDDARRPLWFVYSGMGSQWAGMGTQLMRIPVFAAAIERCQQVLKSKGLDIVDIITSPDKKTFDNILHSFVGIAAIQIGLTDILHETGLVPDGIIGHSVGELGCAYADGCLTAEEMILAAYSRGMASLETPLIRGSMAAVGLGYAEVSNLCPPGIDVACRNSADSSTISGPADLMREFVAQLTASGVFAKEVPCSNIAYHSRYIKDAGPNLLRYLKEVIKHPKRRSERWVSTSVPRDKWNEEEAKQCSAEYHTNNLLSPVFFEETTEMIPNNAVLVEVAPHGLLQAILKRSMPANCLNVPLTKRGHSDNVLYLLQAIGGLYLKGYLPKLQALYPKVEFPVSTGTPMLSHLIEWVHVDDWDMPTVSSQENRTASIAQFKISIHDEDLSYLQGNIVRGKMCYPYASALIAVWDTLSMSLDIPKRQMPVQFSDIHIYSQPLLHGQRALQLDVSINKGTGLFEVMKSRSRVMSGYVTSVSKLFNIKGSTSEPNNMTLSSNDVYQLLEERDYNYNGEFRSIECCSPSFCEAMLLWQDNFATLIDAMMQLNVLQQQHDAVSVPTHIRNICIDVKQHGCHIELLNNKRVMNANVIPTHNYTRCGGITIENITFKNLSPTKEGLENLKMVVPHGLGGNNFEAKSKKETRRNPMTLQSSEVGKLDSLQWEAVPELESSALTVDVHYTGINMLDMKRASGAIPNEAGTYGMDYSGVTKSGERVMGIVRSGAASSQVQPQPEFLWPVPAHWTLEDAATVPLAYALAFYCLKIKGELEPGMNVLVTGGCGAAGQAAISILLAHNCRVFTTVSDVRKKQFLKKLYPQLKDADIGYSRDGYFVDHIKSASNKGCQIIVSCLKGNQKTLYIGCLRHEGRYLDMVQDLDYDPFMLGMGFMFGAKMYFRVDMTSLFQYNKYEDMKLIQAMLSDGIADGYVRPLSRVTYASQDVTRAFRLLAASQHRGRVLLNMRENITKVQQRIICKPNTCQVLFCLNNSNVLGVQLVQRLIKRGAKKIYIHVTKSTAYHQLKIESWRKLGIEVTLSSHDLIKSEDVATVLSDATNIGAVEGIYIIASNNYGGIPKEDLTRTINNIDLSSRILCPELRYFAVVSTDGYLALDMSSSRAASGYPATSLDLYPLNEVETSENRLTSYLTMEAIERAICSPYNLLQAQKAIKQPLSLLQQIAALADIEVTSNTNAELTLRDLGVAEEKVPHVGAYLILNYNISLMENELLFLTINKINELEETMSEIIHPKVKGLATFFTKGSAHDLLDTADLMALPTLFKDSSLTPGEFDVHKRYICIVPGTEGHHGRFHLLCDRLKLPAVVLQTGLDHPDETVAEMGQRCANILVDKKMTQDNFYLLGYESGVMVALEMVAKLEENGLTGTVFLMGYDPEEFKLELAEQLSDLATDKQLEDALVRHIVQILSSEHLSELDNALEAAATWSQKVDICVRYLRGRTTHSIQYTRNLMETALFRMKQLRSYKAVVRPLRSQLVLLRAATNRASPDFAKTLQPHSSRPVVVHQLHAPLAHLPHDNQSSAIVNKYLDAETRQAFENKSQCVTYVVNQSLQLTVN